MRQGSTPTHIFETDIDLTDAKVFVTYKQNVNIVLEKIGTVSNNIVTVRLSQADTLLFREKEDVKIQLRYIKSDGTSDSSDIMTVEVEEVLKKGLISYED